MKEFCGYKALDGSLHETEESCRTSDYDFKVREIKRKFDRIDEFIISQLIDSYRYATGKDYVHNNTIEDIVIYIFANKREELLDIYRQGDLMKKELDELKKNNDNKPSYISNWWLKLKWWK